MTRKVKRAELRGERDLEVKGRRQEENLHKAKKASISYTKSGSEQQLRVNRHLVPPLHYNERQYQILLCKRRIRILLSSIDIRQTMEMNNPKIAQS